MQNVKLRLLLLARFKALFRPLLFLFLRPFQNIDDFPVMVIAAVLANGVRHRRFLAVGTNN